MKKIILVLSLILVACSNISIPAGYQGTFVEPISGLKVVLESGKVSTQSKDAKAVALGVNDLKAETLLKGKAGAYVASSSDNMIDLYLVVPDMTTKQEANGMVWYNAEVGIAAIEPKQKVKQNSVKFLHCLKGMVLIDTATKQVQVGCGEDTEELVLTRIK